MGFKLKSGNKVDFKMMGSSPVRDMKDGDYSQSFEKPGPPQTTKFTHNWDNNDSEIEGNFSTADTYTGGFGEETPSLIQEKKEENDVIKKATDGEVVDKDVNGNVVTDDNKNTAGAELKTTSDKYNPDGTLKEGDKKWHETDAFRNTGAGHIVDAVKSIRRGIKKNKAKRAENKKTRLAEANKAIEGDTQTLKQQKLVDRANKQQKRKDIKSIRKQEKDRIKLAKYNKRKKS